jgi:hypothetical protein
MLAERKAQKEDDQARVEAKMDANQPKVAKQEEMLAEMSGRMEANHKKMMAKIDAETDAI